MKNSTRSLHVIIDTDIVPESYEQIIDDMNNVKSEILNISFDDIDYEDKTADLLLALTDKIMIAGIYQIKLNQTLAIIERLKSEVKQNIKSKKTNP